MPDHEMPPTITIRACDEGDVAEIAAIYAHHVLTGLASFETEPPSAAEMARRRADLVGRGMPYLVAVEDGEVVGYAYAGPFRARPAYGHTVEDSVYVRADRARRGIGRILLKVLIAECAGRGFRQAVAVIGDSGNAGSIRVHEAVGFRRVGTLRAVGFKFDRWVDVVQMQRPLGDGDVTLPALR